MTRNPPDIPPVRIYYTTMEDRIICDVCSEVLPRTQLPGHIDLHASQLARLCNQLVIPTLELPEGNNNTDDSDTGCSITGEDGLVQGNNQPSQLKPFECPDKTCDHRAFGRRQDLIRHFMRHCEINKRCDGCGKRFRFANKYVSHKHVRESTYKTTARSGFDEVRGHVKAALDRANDARKTRNNVPGFGQQRKRKSDLSKDLPGFEQQKKQKSVLPSDISKDAPKDSLCLPSAAQPTTEGAASFDSLVNPRQSLGGLVDIDGSLVLSAEEAAAAPFVLHSDLPHTSTGISGSSESYHTATNYVHDIESVTQQAIPSEPPNLWEMAAWPTDWALDQTPL
ncbi:hypothetical protein F4808DRAFT_94552 [Astrocystis sublimbata]|nr:hypothetical protein F4808DRAFT_94552 [Astrocystis sublimbata]